MTRIDFYVLNDAAAASRERLACRLTEKAFGLGHRVHLHVASAQAAGRLDDLLWTFRDGSFVPHEIAGGDAVDSPVTIGHDWEPTGDCQVLINLADEVPVFFSRFERVAEIINQDEQIRSQGRERFRFYRDRGYDLNTHELAAE